MNSENSNSEDFGAQTVNLGTQNKGKLNLQLKEDPQQVLLAGPLPCEITGQAKSISLGLSANSQALDVQQANCPENAVESLTNNVNQLILSPILQSPEDKNKSINGKSCRQINRKLLAQQREMKKNLKKIQKYFKNGAVEDKEQVLCQLEMMKKRTIQLVRKHFHH